MGQNPNDTADTFGPIQLFVVEFDGARPDGRVLAELADLGRRDQVRLVDLVVATREADGTVTMIEWSDLAPDVVELTELAGEGLVGAADVDQIITDIAPGRGVALAAIEMVWAKELASAFASVGGHVVDIALVPAPAVNQLLETASASGEEI